VILHTEVTSSCQVNWVDTPDSLLKMAAHLAQCKSIAFDTEFDSNRRTYGFTLLLMQMFDGKEIWLIDPLLLDNLNPIWPVFENESIRKIGYALGEDVRLLKSFGCHPRGLYDIQVARRLCDKPEAGLARALEEDLGVVLDKVHQRSDWARRPLSASQVDYLTNDVVHLFSLTDANAGFVSDTYLQEVFTEEMQLLEAVEYIGQAVKLSRAHEKKFDEDGQRGLLGLLVARDTIARELNVPASFVVQNEQVEEILMNRNQFLDEPFSRGFHPRVRREGRLRSLFLEAVRACPEECGAVRWESSLTRVERMALREERLDREERAIREVFLPLESRLLETYPEEIVRFLLRGVRKAITTSEQGADTLRPYQRKLVWGDSGETGNAD